MPLQGGRSGRTKQRSEVFGAWVVARAGVPGKAEVATRPQHPGHLRKRQTVVEPVERRRDRDHVERGVAKGQSTPPRPATAGGRRGSGLELAQQVVARLGGHHKRRAGGRGTGSERPLPAPRSSTSLRPGRRAASSTAASGYPAARRRRVAATSSKPPFSRSRVSASIGVTGATARSRVHHSPSASRTGMSLAAVSASSSAGSESATMPQPANSRTWLPSNSAERKAMPHSPSPSASIHPTGLANLPRSSRSISSISATALPSGCRPPRRSGAGRPPARASWRRRRAPR